MRESTEITKKNPPEIPELKNTVKEIKTAIESVNGRLRQAEKSHKPEDE